MQSQMMRVEKRDGRLEEVSFDKVLRRIRKLSEDLSINYFEVAQKICSRIYDGVKTTQLDELTAQTCSSLVMENLDYSKLASRIIISNHHKNTEDCFSAVMDKLYNFEKHGKHSPIINKRLHSLVMKNAERIDNYIDYDRDYSFDYFGFKTLERSYLNKINKVIVERPQHMIMRVSLAIHSDNITRAFETYDLISNKYFTHATPTLFNAGGTREQLASCFLVSLNEDPDSIEGIFDGVKECAQISKFAGGIGIHLSEIRGTGSHIKGTNGYSSGLIPYLRIFNNTARAVNQAGRRAGSIAVYMEPWHTDIESVLELRKNHGNEEERARDLFYALWIPDLFMERVKNNEMWSLMNSNECPGLCDACGENFKALYEQYEREGKYTKQVTAQSLWFKILQAQIEQGMPYICYKDASNKKSNQQNLGTIKSSNLCAEIIEYSGHDETATCNLSSICLPSFIKYDNDGKVLEYDFDKLHEVAKVVTRNIDNIIDITFYPIEKTRKSNLRHRPIGVGVQGLADTLAILKIPYDSFGAQIINKQIFETIYHGCMERSMEIAKERYFAFLAGESVHNEYETEAYNSKYPGAYTSFEGSPLSQGKFQFNLWGEEDNNSRYDWGSLRKDIMKFGVRNSLVTALMPTASTSQIMGYNESFEPFTSNIYKRKTLAGEFICVNKYLIKDLMEYGLWNNDMKDNIIINEGSIQHIDIIPEKIRRIYRTSWDMSQKAIIDMCADRGRYVCQSQSMNLFLEEPTFKKITSMHFYAWSSGLKTGVYYLRTKPRANAIMFTIDPSKIALLKKQVEQKEDESAKEGCLMCSG